MVSRADRELPSGHRGMVIWLTGLSGSDKSTQANAFAVALHDKGVRTCVLCGDHLRAALSRDLDFTLADRVENMLRIAEVSQLMMNAGLVVLVASIAPFAMEREMAKILMGSAYFLDVYFNTPIEIYEKRDVKGLYKQAREKEIADMTGISSPYEIPDSPAYIAKNHDVPIDQTIRELMGLFASSTR